MRIHDFSLRCDLVTIVSYFLIVVFVIINVVTLPHYGISWDEPYHFQIGRAAVNYLRTGQAHFIAFTGINYQYYGQILEIVNDYAADIFTSALSVAYIDARHILLVFIAGLGALALFHLAKMLFGSAIALFALIFFFLFPRFWGDVHYNPKDIPLMVLSLTTALFLLRAFTQRSGIYAFLAGISLGLGMAIRVDAVLIVPIFFFAYGLQILRTRTRDDRRVLRRDALLAAIFLVVAAVVSYLAWPSLWRDPLLFFHSLSYFQRHSWPELVMYFGKLYRGSGLPWHYTAVYFFITTPAIMLPLITFGFYVAVKNFVRQRAHMRYGLLLSWFIIPLLISIKPGLVRYDGIRHFYLLLPAMAIIAGLGLRHIISVMAQYLSIPHIPIGLILSAAIAVFLAREVYYAHPYEGYYFNSFIRMVYPQHLENYFDFEYWGTSYRVGVQWLNDHAAPRAVICVPIAEHLLRWYAVRSDLSFGCDGDYSYLMFITRYSFLPAEKADEVRRLPPPIFTVSRYHSDLLHIYKL